MNENTKKICFTLASGLFTASMIAIAAAGGALNAISGIAISSSDSSTKEAKKIFATSYAAFWGLVMVSTFIFTQTNYFRRTGIAENLMIQLQQLIANDTESDTENDSDSGDEEAGGAHYQALDRAAADAPAAAPAANDAAGDQDDIEFTPCMKYVLIPVAMIFMFATLSLLETVAASSNPIKALAPSMSEDDILKIGLAAFPISVALNIIIPSLFSIGLSCIEAQRYRQLPQP